MGTRKNRLILNEAVLTCTHNQCFEQKYEKHHTFSSENYRFYSREILLYIAWACLRNDLFIFRTDSLEPVPILSPTGCPRKNATQIKSLIAYFLENYIYLL